VKITAFCILRHVVSYNELTFQRYVLTPIIAYQPDDGGSKQQPLVYFCETTRRSIQKVVILILIAMRT
jgi:hypothetical protein